jgi:hypothetical protein
MPDYRHSQAYVDDVLVLSAQLAGQSEHSRTGP